MNPAKKLKLEIPGYYYDEDKGKYFKVEKKSTQRDHPYRPDNLKLKEKLKLQTLARNAAQKQKKEAVTRGIPQSSVIEENLLSFGYLNSGFLSRFPQKSVHFLDSPGISKVADGSPRLAAETAQCRGVSLPERTDWQSHEVFICLSFLFFFSPQCPGLLF